MIDPAILASIARVVAEAERTSALIDDRVAAGTAEMMVMVATSRECVAHSRQVLAEFEGAPDTTEWRIS
jgi:hypothetical protein